MHVIILIQGVVHAVKVKSRQYSSAYFVLLSKAVTLVIRYNVYAIYVSGVCHYTCIMSGKCRCTHKNSDQQRKFCFVVVSRNSGDQVAADQCCSVVLCIAACCSVLSKGTAPGCLSRYTSIIIINMYAHEHA